MDAAQDWKEFLNAIQARDSDRMHNFAARLLKAQQSKSSPPNISGHKEFVTLNWVMAIAACHSAMAGGTFVSDSNENDGLPLPPEKSFATADSCPALAADSATNTSGWSARRAREQQLMKGVKVVAYREQALTEPPLLETGKIFEFREEERFEWFVSLVPRHYVDVDCDCEPGAVLPYLVAWRDGNRGRVRQLTLEESRDLQLACLAAQAEEHRVSSSNNAESMSRQRLLW